MSEDEGEFVSDSYRRRHRLMNRLLAPFDIAEFVLLAVCLFGALAVALTVL